MSSLQGHRGSGLSACASSSAQVWSSVVGRHGRGRLEACSCHIQGSRVQCRGKTYILHGLTVLANVPKVLEVQSDFSRKCIVARILILFVLQVF